MTEEGKQSQQVQCAYSRAAIALLKGIVSREDDEAVWQELLKYRSQLSDYFAVLGLRVEIDKFAEYACLRQIESAALPTLVPRYQLGFGVSLLLVELRRMQEENVGLTADGRGAERLRVTLDDMVERLALFLPPQANEQRLMQQVERYMSQAVNMGFLRRPRYGKAQEYEVHPALRSFVDAQWLSNFDKKLAEYIAYARQGRIESDADEGMFAAEPEAQGTADRTDGDHAQPAAAGSASGDSGQDAIAEADADSTPAAGSAADAAMTEEED